jgi:hypothetical protein
VKNGTCPITRFNQMLEKKVYSKLKRGLRMLGRVMPNSRVIIDGDPNLESLHSQNTLVINYITSIYASGSLCSTDGQQVYEKILYK